MKVSSVAVVLLLLVSLTSMSTVLQNTSVAELGGDNGDLMVLQFPVVDNVCSLQPVYVLINRVGDTFVEVDIEVRVDVEGFALPVKPPSPMFTQYRFPVVPFHPGWGIAYIPGLLAKSYIVEYKPPIGPPIALPVKVVSKVVYRVYVNGSTVYEQMYVVKDCLNEVDLSPLTYAFIAVSIKDPELFDKTLGLTLPGWVAEAERPIELIALAIDDKELLLLDAEYSVSGGPWIKAAASEVDLGVNKVVQDITEYLASIESFFKQLGRSIEIPKPSKTFMVIKAVIPGQSAGKYVLFRSRAIDGAGKVSESPTGLYYVTNTASDTRILVIDPNIELWLAKYNADKYSNYLHTYLSYSIPQNFVDEIGGLAERAERLKAYGPPFFHYWNRISRYYNIYIVRPREAVEALDGFRPSVVVLSNLYLGIKDTPYLDWDLRNLNVLDDLVKYVKENHVGVIATHGTLSDLVVWTSCEARVRIGSRGLVGDQVQDLDPVNERTIASLLGLPELTLWEIVRDHIARSICGGAAPYLVWAGLLIGSIPLQVPYVPFSGKLKATPEAGYVEWYIPEEFEVTVAEARGELGFSAYTEVGWQLALPRALAHRALEKAGDAKTLAKGYIERFSGFLANVALSRDLEALARDGIERSLEHGLVRLYRALSSSRISLDSIRLSLELPGLETINTSISIPKEHLEKLANKMPVKIVALSDDGLAGVVVYDKYWDANGYRSVYFSFEIEAVDSDTAERLFVQAVEWARKWEYKPITEVLGSVRMPKEIAEKAKSILEGTPGHVVDRLNVLLNEEGLTEISLNTSPGRMHVIVVHPTTEIVEVVHVAGIYTSMNVSRENRVTRIIIETNATTTIEIGLRASTDQSLNPAYIEIKQEPATTTPTATPTPTPALTPTPAPITPVEQPSPTPTPAQVQTPATTPVIETPTTTPVAPTATALPWIILAGVVAVVIIVILVKKRY